MRKQKWADAKRMSLTQNYYKTAFVSGSMGFGFDFSGKKAVVLGIANEESIAYAIAKKLNDAGCTIAIGYQERNKEAVSAP